MLHSTGRQTPLGWCDSEGLAFPASPLVDIWDLSKIYTAAFPLHVFLLGDGGDFRRFHLTKASGAKIPLLIKTPNV